MTSPRPAETSETSLTHDLIYAARYYFGGRRGLVVLVAVIAAGLALNWGWLVAVGIAPILLGVLPCAAMCALGLCMNRKADGSCATQPDAERAVDTTAAQHATVVRTVPIEPPTERPGGEYPGGAAVASELDPGMQSVTERGTTDA